MIFLGTQLYCTYYYRFFHLDDVSGLIMSHLMINVSKLPITENSQFKVSSFHVLTWSYIILLILEMNNFSTLLCGFQLIFGIFPRSVSCMLCKASYALVQWRFRALFRVKPERPARMIG